MKNRPYPQPIWSNVVVGLLALLLAAWALIPGLNDYSLWLDDVQVIEGAETLHSWGDIFHWERVSTSRVNPPLYYVLLKGWTAVAGDSDLVLRVPAVLLALIGAAAVYRVTQDFSRRPLAGFAAAVIFGNIGFVDYYAHVVHAYTLFLAGCGLLMLNSLRWWQNQRRVYAVGVAFFTALVLYTHYYGIYFVVGLNVALLLFHARQLRRLMPQWIAIHILALVFFSAWIPATYELASGGYQNSPEYEGNIGISGSNVGFLLKKMTRRFFYDGIKFYAGLFLVGVVATALRRRYRRPVGRIVLFLLAVIGISLLSALLGNVILQSFVPRRLIFLLVPIAVLLGCLLAQLRPAVLLGTVAVFLLATPDRPLSTGLPGNWFYREAVTEVAAQVQPGDAVYIDYNDDLTVLPLRYYADRLLAPIVPYHFVMDNPAAIINIIWPRERLWVIQRSETPIPWSPPLDQKQFAETSRVLIGDHYVLLYTATGPARVIPETTLENPTHLAWPQTFGDLFRLDNSRIDTLTVAPGATLAIWPEWTLLQPTDIDWAFYIHLEDDRGNLWGYETNGSPSHLGYPLPARYWPVGAPIYDHYTLTVNPDTPAGVYVLRIGIYNRADAQRLTVAPGDGRAANDGLIIAEITIE